jgi:hypothetical protein
MLALIQIHQSNNMLSDSNLVKPYSNDLNTILAEEELQWTLLSSGKLRGGYTQTHDMTRDAEGNTYFTGVVESSLFPTIDAYDSSFNGEYDCFVMKFNQMGTLVYSTFIGGSASEYGTAIEVDDFGNIYVAGWTFSTDFPIVNANQSENNGNWDCFVSKLDPSGSTLLFSTYVGGSSTDELTDIALDSDGNVYATGHTVSSDFPVVNAIDGTLSSNHDCFVFKLSASGNSINYSTYIGSSGYDNGLSISVDSEDCAYVAGRTSSSSFPEVNPLFERPPVYNKNDCFLLKINSTGTGFNFSTYIGGTDYDQFAYVRLDCNDSIYIVGSTQSVDFPLTNGSFDVSHNGEADIFVMKINSSLNLVYSTVIGGTGYDYPNAMDVDMNGDVIIASTTTSDDCPLVHELQSCDGDLQDVYVCKLISNGTELEFASTIGGTHSDYPSGISVDVSGNITITGVTESTDFPIDYYFGDYPLYESSSFFTKIGKEYVQITTTTTNTTTTTTTTTSTITTTTNTTLPDLSTLASMVISIGSIGVIVVVVVLIVRSKNAI